MPTDAKPEANDNAEPPANAIPFSDLVAASGLDEDTLLQRLAAILNRRKEVPDAD